MRRLALVVIAAMGGFAAALIHFGHADSAQSCLVEPPVDASYSARFDGAVSMDQTNHVLLLTQNGKPVAGATVCLNTWMVGMSGMAMTANSSEASPGRYSVPFQFAMGGPWKAVVVVSPPGGAQVGVPITFSVAAGAMPMSTPGG